VASRRRAAPTRRPVWALPACLAPVTLTVLAGCSRSGAVMEEPTAREVVVVYVAQLMAEHPLYPTAARLSARIAALTAPPDLRALGGLAGEPLRRRPLGPPKIEAPVPGALTMWEAQADAALAAQVQEAEESLGAWPHPELGKTETRLRRQTADALRQAQNQAEIERLRVEVGEIRRRRDELAELRQLAASEDREEAARALDRQAALWREIDARVRATQRQAEARLRELRETGEAEMTEALAAAREHAETERAAHLRGLREAGEAAREQQPEAVESATVAVEPATSARDVPPPPDTTELTALLDDIEAAQRAAQQRRVSRLVTARTRLLREVALSTQSAVRAVAVRNGLDVSLEPETGQALRDATEELRPLLREYWAARPAISGVEP